MQKGIICFTLETLNFKKYLINTLIKDKNYSKNNKKKKEQMRKKNKKIWNKMQTTLKIFKFRIMKKRIKIKDF